MRCATHPEVETGLSCGKCLKPICPRCLVQTPVGARCAQCAGLKKLPTFMLSTVDYTKAIFAGIGASVVLGAAWYFVRFIIPFVTLLNFFLAAAAGYGIGEVISLSVNRKRGLALKVVGGLCALAAFVVANELVGFFYFVFTFNLFELLAAGVAVYLAVSRL